MGAGATAIISHVETNAPVSNNTTGTSTQSPEIDDSDDTGAIVAGMAVAGAVAACRP